MSKHSAKDAAFAKIRDEERFKCRTAGGKCWICHKKIDTLLVKEDPKSFTLDHVDPTSKGADKHRRANLKWAHRDCNSSRGNGNNMSKVFTSRRW